MKRITYAAIAVAAIGGLAYGGSAYQELSRAERQKQMVNEMLLGCLERESVRYGHGSPEHLACVETAKNWFDKPAG